PRARPSPDHKNPVQNHPAYYIFYLCCSLNALLECSSDYNRLSGIFPQNISIITQLMHSMPYIITCYFICIVSCTVHFIRKMYYVIPSVPVSEEPQNINRSAAASLRQFLFLYKERFTCHFFRLLHSHQFNKRRHNIGQTAALS